MRGDRIVSPYFGFFVTTSLAIGKYISLHVHVDVFNLKKKPFAFGGGY